MPDLQHVTLSTHLREPPAIILCLSPSKYSGSSSPASTLQKLHDPIIPIFTFTHCTIPLPSIRPSQSRNPNFHPQFPNPPPNPISTPPLSTRSHASPRTNFGVPRAPRVTPTSCSRRGSDFGAFRRSGTGRQVHVRVEGSWGVVLGRLG